MGKQRTVRGAYSSDSLGKDRVTEMDPRRTKAFTVDDGKSLADLIDRNSTDESNYGHVAPIKRGAK
jgi:hypothetical protein